MRWSLLFSALFIITPATAQQAADAAQAMARMMEADANHDGKVTRAELIMWRASNFVRFDRDRDGVLAPDDIPAFLRASSVGLQLESMIKQYDTDADRRLSRAEFVDGPTPLFDLADANHDGCVTKAEADAATVQLRAGGAR